MSKRQLIVLMYTLATIPAYAGKDSCKEKPKIKKGQTRYHVAKFFENAANAKCIGQIQHNEPNKTKATLRRLRIKIRGTNYNLAHASAEVFHAIDSLGDGSFHFHHGVSVLYPGNIKKNDDGTTSISHQSTCNFEHHRLEIRPGCQNRRSLGPNRDRYPAINNVVNIAHEWAHCFGHRALKRNRGVELFGIDQKNYKKRRIYDYYKDFVKPEGSCRPTVYSDRRGSENFKVHSRYRNEEFAEVFALYITDPDQLRVSEGNPNNRYLKGCKKAIRFFAKLFGERIPPEGVSGITCESRAQYFKRVMPPTLSTTEIRDRQLEYRNSSGAARPLKRGETAKPSGNF